MNIAIDIDWILTIETEWHNYSERTPNTEMIKKINELAEQNNIIIYTARDICDRKITIQWLCDNWVKYDDIIFWKPKYDILLDDRATNNLTELQNMIWKSTSQE